MDDRIKIGVSACLLGQPVRFDGSHKHDRYLTGTLGEYLEFVPVCPEVEAGFPVPRETFRLVGDPQNPRLLTTRTGVDHTERMTAWAEQRVRELEAENLCGFIFKSDSPSSGLERVKVYNDKGMAEKKGVGLFARAFTRHFPLLPVEEEVLPLIVPVTLLNHYVRKYDEPYLKQQLYLNPHPLVLKLRNHA